MKRYLGISVLMVVAAVIFAAGCPPPTSVDDSGEAHPEGPAATLTAYINVSSGCQQHTVDFIRDLESKYTDQLTVEFIDFGDEGEGNKAWKDAGLKCMTLQIDGNSTVTWGEGEDKHTVAFTLPAGLSWTHEDLAEAIQAAIEGRLQPGDPEQAEAVGILEVKVSGQSVKVGDTGPETGQLTINDAVIVEVTQSRGDLDPAQRVTAAAEALTRALEKPFKPDALSVEQVEEGWAVMADDQPLLVATDTDAEAAEVEPKELASEWLVAIRKGLVAAASAPSRQPEA